MGIKGLLEQLKSITKKIHISEFRGKRVAIDAHCWLHRGAYGCGKELYEGIDTTKYISFMLNMIHMLKSNGIESIIIVFDGIPLPCKAETNNKRTLERQQQLLLAKSAEISGDHDQAHNYYQRSISITYDMIQKVIIALDKIGVYYIVAPYETDAQLAYLSKNNIVDIIITEDSDAIIYGCQHILYKLNKQGYGEYIEYKNLTINQSMSFQNWSTEQFQLFCCLSGCDYITNIRNIGIKTAYKIVNTYKTLDNVLQHLSFIPSITENFGFFRIQLIKALLTFQSQTIYNPFTKQTEPLNSIQLTYIHKLYNITTCSAITTTTTTTTTTPNISNNDTIHSKQHTPLSLVDTDYSFLGPQLDSSVVELIVTGNIDPNSLVESMYNTTIPTTTIMPTASTVQQSTIKQHNTTTTTTNSSKGNIQNTDYNLPITSNTTSSTLPTIDNSSIVWAASDDPIYYMSSDSTTSKKPPTATAVISLPDRGIPEPSKQRKRKHENNNNSNTNAHTTTTTKSTTATTTGTGISSAAAASYASQSFHSSLLSTTLQPLHRTIKAHTTTATLPLPTTNSNDRTTTTTTTDIDTRAATDTTIPTVLSTEHLLQPPQEVYTNTTFFDTPTTPAISPICFNGIEVPTESDSNSADCSNAQCIGLLKFQEGSVYSAYNTILPYTNTTVVATTPNTYSNSTDNNIYSENTATTYNNQIHNAYNNTYITATSTDRHSTTSTYKGLQQFQEDYTTLHGIPHIPKTPKPPSSSSWSPVRFPRSEQIFMHGINATVNKSTATTTTSNSRTPGTSSTSNSSSTAWPIAHSALWV